MPAEFSTFDYEGRTLEYRFRPPKRDRRQIVVVFSGGFVGGIDFAGKSLALLESAILWIRDKENSYYIQKGDDDWYSHAVHALIEHYRTIFGATKNDVTLLGASKGGTAALFHGLRFGYSNIVASAPRIHPARGNISERPKIVEALVGSREENAMAKFDRILPNLVADADIDFNIYLFTSQMDGQYQTDIEPNLDLFKRFQNFNLIVTDSPSVNQHEDVTLYNIQPIVGLLCLLADGLTPKIGNAANGFNSRTDRPKTEANSFFNGEVVNSVDQLSFRDGGLWMTGRSFIRGIDASDYSSVRRYLHFENKRQSMKSYLGGLKDRRNNRDYFDDLNLDYSAGGYAPQGNKPISIEKLEYGKYKLFMEIKSGGVTKKTDEFEIRKTYLLEVADDYLIQVQSKQSKITLKKIPLHLTSNIDGNFTVDEYWINEKKLHLSGSFSLNNVEATDWKDVDYKLIIINESNRSIAALLNMAKFSKKQEHKHWEDDSKANYSTPRHSGITLPELGEGRYRMAMLGDFNNQIHTIDTRLALSIGPHGEVVELGKS